MITYMADIVSHHALDALVTEALTPQRWQSRNQLASECGFSPTSLSLACAGKRGFSEKNLSALLECTGWKREAIELPVLARPGDVETRRLVEELRRRREQDSKWQSEMLMALQLRNGG